MSGFDPNLPSHVVSFQVPENGDLSGLFSSLTPEFLVQSAIGACVEDHITEHAELLVESLDERGPDAWMRACTCVTALLTGTSHTGTGTEAAQRFRSGIHPEVQRQRAMWGALQLQAAMIEGPQTFQDHAGALPAAELRDATRALIALAIAGCGWVRDGPAEPMFAVLIPKPDPEGTTTP